MKWWQIGKRDADLERELQSDLQLEEEEQREHGIAPEEARYAALRAFGNPSVISEQTREVWSWDRLETLLRDLRISIRTLARQPGFSAVVMLVIAVGIGATTFRVRRCQADEQTGRSDLRDRSPLLRMFRTWLASDGKARSYRARFSSSGGIVVEENP